MSAAVVARAQESSATYVTHDAAPLRAAVVVRPSFAIETLPPIQGEPSPIGQRAIEQSDVMLARLRAHGAELRILQSEPESPFGFAVQDLAVVVGRGAILMRPTDLARRREVVRIEATLRDADVPILGRIEAPGFLDGGDVIVAGDTLFVASAYDRQSAIGIARLAHGNVIGLRQLAAIAEGLGIRAVQVPMASEVRRLRSVAALIDERTILVGTTSLDPAAFDGFTCIVADDGEDYGAGVLALRPRRVLANVRFRRLLPALRRGGIRVDAIDLWEFGKLGITPSSLVLPLKRG